MTNSAVLVLIFGIPIAGACIVPFLGRLNSALRNLAALVFVLAPLAILFLLIPGAYHKANLSLNYVLPFGVNFNFTADLLAVFMGIVSASISAGIVIYSFDYISHYENQNEYYFLVLLFVGAMMGLVLSANLIFLYVFWEITAFASWRLIGFFRKEADVRRADKSFLVTVFGALLMLAGFLGLYWQCGSFDLSVIRESLAAKPISLLWASFILAGMFSKSATLPFHTWLPDAGVAPSPVTALLHAAVLVKIGVYVYARLFLATFVLPPVLSTWVMYLAAASALVSAGAAYCETDIKRIIAYSTVSQIAYIFMGLATGTVIGAAGALLYILMHGLAKAGLFLCAGIVEQNTKTKDIRELGGLIRTMPVTAGAFLLCAFSVMGLPPFGGFFGKFMVIAGAFRAGDNTIAILFLVGAVLTILYLFRLFSMVFLGEPKKAANEGSPVMVYTVAAFAVLSLVGGIFIYYPALVANAASVVFLGVR